MAEKRYYWLKLHEDFFTSKRIKRLRNLAGGDTYTIIYLKMQLKALKSDGFLYFDGLMESFAEELALDIDESPDNVKVTVSYLLSCGLLETNDDAEYKLTYMDNVIGSETAHTQRQRNYIMRQKERQASLNDGNASFCDGGVTKMLRGGDVEIEKEIEKDKEIEIYPPKSPRGDNGKSSDFQNPFSGDLKEAFDDWLAYKRERHQAYKDLGLKSLVTQVKKYVDKFGAAETADAIRTSMSNNYQGIVFDRIGKNAGTEDRRRRAKAPEEYRGKDFFSDGGL